MQPLEASARALQGTTATLFGAASIVQATYKTSSVLASCGLLAHVAGGKWEVAIVALKQARDTPRGREIQKAGICFVCAFPSVEASGGEVCDGLPIRW